VISPAPIVKIMSKWEASFLAISKVYGRSFPFTAKGIDEGF
jgi:hypothetical protein